MAQCHVYTLCTNSASDAAAIIVCTYRRIPIQIAERFTRRSPAINLWPPQWDYAVCKLGIMSSNRHRRGMMLRDSLLHADVVIATVSVSALIVHIKRTSTKEWGPLRRKGGALKETWNVRGLRTMKDGGKLWYNKWTRMCWYRLGG